MSEELGQVLKEGYSATLVREAASFQIDGLVYFEMSCGVGVWASGICAEIIRQCGYVPDALSKLSAVDFGMDGEQLVYKAGEEAGFWFVSVPEIKRP